MIPRSYRIKNLYDVINENLKKHGRVTVAWDAVEEAFSGAIEHHPMYFPLPSMPESSDVITDFKRWMKIQGWGYFIDRDNMTFHIRRSRSA